MIGFYTGLRISEAFALTWDDIDFEKRTLSVNKQVVKRNFGADVRKVVEKFQSTLPRGERQQNCTHSQYFFRELCESCQNLQITLTNYSFFYLIICFLQSFSSANQLVFSCSLIIRTN